MLTRFLRFYAFRQLAGALPIFVLAWLLAGAAQAQNPVVPGQSPLRRLNPPTGQPGQPSVNGPTLSAPNRSVDLDSLRRISGHYLAQTSAAPTLVLFDLTVGYARPVGSFADSPSGGAATGGGTLAIGAAYLFKPWVGVFATLSGGLHGVREEAIASRLGLAAQQATRISYGKAGWSHAGFLLGPQFALPLGHAGGLALDVRPGVGFAYVTSPRYSATFLDSAGTQQHQFSSSAAAFAPAFQLGAAVRVPLGEQLGLRLGADYFYARPAFSDYDANTPVVLANSYTRRPVSYLQFSAGLVVRFD